MNTQKTLNAVEIDKEVEVEKINCSRKYKKKNA